VAANVGAQLLVRNVGASANVQNGLDGAANIVLGIEQRAVDVE
jgi:hypothetical protein